MSKGKSSIHNDGTCVYFDSAVEIAPLTKLLLVVFNIAAVAFWFLLFSAFSEEKLTGGNIVTLFVVLPFIYCVSLGLITFWNLFGEENIIINVTSIGSRKKFGFFKTSWNLRQFKRLHYAIEPVEKKKGIDLGVIHFQDYTNMNMPVVIFSSSVHVPVQQLEQLVEHLDVVFAIEHLTDTGSDYVHLN